ncbi:MAG: peptidylprolyl isomerase [Desulfobacteraceae bacterium]|nr:peptidylprolyl isomerase [Desulfobacteraceae bacterium]MDH3572565.1 peptidylprolyl isomerase [Desulfobacteraceae bacterium]MDH3720154.1 peptidylprolyl isomerase [Desulfobacteraceae bacterium]MDH3835691.1 peptidylprolyl isomerase [Desulfobacteraceae bacterium]MDH3873129.1 peptidylprolyl isomerase [Desulfobacteraceae bacterium]
MTKAKTGDRVKVHFEGYLVDGTVFGSTTDEKPFEFTIGDKNMLPGFENAVVGMQKGDTKTIILPPEEAYGPHKKELVHVMDKSSFPQEINLEIGKRLQVRTQDGRSAIVTIKDFTEDNIVIDENDPLAGKTLTFKVELVEII